MAVMRVVDEQGHTPVTASNGIEALHQADHITRR
jgi:hypothetical protein